MIIDHQGEKQTLQSGRFPLDALTFIAFYADCYHQVKPVKTGYRVALTYNLILENANKPTDTIHQPDAENALLTPQTVKLCLLLIESYGASWFLEMLQIWAQSKDRWEAIIQCEQISQIVSVLADQPVYQPFIQFLLTYQWEQLQKQSAENKRINSRVQLLESAGERLKDFQELMCACWIGRQEEMLMEIVAHLTSDKTLYPVLNLVVLTNSGKTAADEKLLRYIVCELQTEKELEGYVNPMIGPFAKQSIVIAPIAWCLINFYNPASNE